MLKRGKLHREKQGEVATGVIEKGYDVKNVVSDYSLWFNFSIDHLVKMATQDKAIQILKTAFDKDCLQYQNRNTSWVNRLTGLCAILKLQHDQLEKVAKNGIANFKTASPDSKDRYTPAKAAILPPEYNEENFTPFFNSMAAYGTVFSVLRNDIKEHLEKLMGHKLCF